MDRNKIVIKTSILGIVVNILLVIFKAIIGFLANSIAIILDAVNNLTDVLSSIITIIGTKLANKLPDKNHPYGHGRIEYLTSVIIAAIILYAGIIAFRESFLKIIHPTTATYSFLSILIIAVAVLAKILLGTYVKKIGKKVNSNSLVASGEDAVMDSILSFSTLVAALISIIWHVSLEGYLGLIISLVIIKTAIGLLKESANLILGTRADSDLSKKLKERIVKFKEVQGAYDLNLHNYGPAKTVASVNIQVRNDMTAEEIHILTREIIYQIYHEYGITLTIGIYAANDKGEFGKIKKDLFNITKEYKEVLEVHGFYVDKKKKNIFFDLIIDFACDDKIGIRNEIVKKIKNKYPEYNYNVIIDSDITD